MGAYYQAQVQISKQEDGLWRVEVPGLQGCWVDAPTLEKALSDIQEAIALILDVHFEDGRPLPASVEQRSGEPTKATLPIVVEEYAIKRLPIPKAKKGKSRDLLRVQA